MPGESLKKYLGPKQQRLSPYSNHAHHHQHYHHHHQQQQDQQQQQRQRQSMQPGQPGHQNLSVTDIPAATDVSLSQIQTLISTHTQDH
eukprot:jgi/Chrzof1/1955/Cz10g27220.t1